MVKNATAEALKTAFEEHLRETEAQVERLEDVFEMLELAARGKTAERNEWACRT